MDKVYKFSELEEKIRSAIIEKQSKGVFSRNGDFNLVIQEGFIVLPIEREVGKGAAFLKTQYLPVVVVVGKESGLVYQFKLGDLLPEVELK
jgi:hypothetical protein